MDSIIILIYFSLIFISSFVYAGLTLVGEENHLDILIAVYVLVILFLGLSVIFREIYKWKLKDTFEYHNFSYKYDLVLFKLTIILSEILYLYTYISIFYYREELNTQLFWIFLIYPPVIIISTYELFSRKLEHLSSFKLKITT